MTTAIDIVAPTLCRYPNQKKLIMAMLPLITLDTTNHLIFEEACTELIHLTGDDELEFELNYLIEELR